METGELKRQESPGRRRAFDVTAPPPVDAECRRQLTPQD